MYMIVRLFLENILQFYTTPKWQICGDIIIEVATHDESLLHSLSCIH